MYALIELYITQNLLNFVEYLYPGVHMRLRDSTICKFMMKMNERLKTTGAYTRLLEGSECGNPPLKEENEDHFVTRDSESPFIKGMYY